MPHLVSVIVPVLDGEAPLGACIESILAQTDADVELIIVASEALAGHREAVEEWAKNDQRLRWEQVSGTLAARINRGLEVANGQLIALQDPRTLAEPRRLELQQGTFQENPRLVLVGGGFLQVTADGAEVARHGRQGSPAEAFWELLFGNAIGPWGTAMWRHGPQWRWGDGEAGDYALWCQMAREGAVGLLGGMVVRQVAEHEAPSSPVAVAAEQQGWLLGEVVPPETAQKATDFLVNGQVSAESARNHVNRLYGETASRWEIEDPEGLAAVRQRIAAAWVAWSKDAKVLSSPVEKARRLAIASSWDGRLVAASLQGQLQRRLKLTVTEDKRRRRKRMLDTLATKLASVPQVQARKTSDTLFILGSGASINEITAPQWRAINEADSLGFNFWLYHDFVPTYYHIEARKQPISTGLGSNAWAHFKALWRRRPDLGQSMMLMDRWDMTAQLSVPEAALWAGEVAMRGRIHLYEGRVILKEYPDSPLAEAFLPPPTSLADPIPRPASASLAVVIGIGAALGYKRIVLMGIDLNRPEYFWTSWNLPHAHKRAEAISASDTRHVTLSSRYGVPVDRVLAALVEGWLEPEGIELLIGSEGSALHPMLPLWR